MQLSGGKVALLSTLVLALGGCGGGNSKAQNSNGNAFTAAMVSAKTFSWAASTGSKGISSFYSDGTFWLDNTSTSVTGSGTWFINPSGQIVKTALSGEVDTLTLVSSSANTLVVSVEEKVAGNTRTLTNTLTLIPTLAAGQTTTVASGQSVEVPSGATVQDTTTGNTVTVNGDHNIINTSAGAIVYVPSNATGPADNTVKAQ